MYKINITCFDPPYSKPPYADKLPGEFERKCEAKESLNASLLREIESLNEPDAHYTPRTNIFVPMTNYKHEGKTYDGAIFMWDGATGIKEQPVTLYEIVWENNTTVDPWNQKLKERFGEDITLSLYSEMVETDEVDENDESIMVEMFYYEGVTCGKSDLYDDVKDAYEEAEYYLDHIEWFLGED